MTNSTEARANVYVNDNRMGDVDYSAVSPSPKSPSSGSGTLV